ncbi:MAG: A/G-specific adenine glycosylase [Janthinobacterium lividum]
MGGAAQENAGPESVCLLEPERFQKALGTWFRKHARELPWRGIRNPYATWLSEIMLQQTRVATVIDRYSEFLERFPTIADLAAAPEDDVLALWSGLGYYRRARMLHRGAQFVVRELRGTLPGTSVELRTLPGVGEYTAAAVASIAFGESIAVLDGNVERVLLRLLGLPEQKTAAARAILLRTANELVPAAMKRAGGKANPPGDHNQAMMELGATICLPRGPLCLHCPVFAFCQTRGEHLTAARTPLRSKHVACLLATRKRGTATEVLLERRAAEATLMPGMLELPPLPLAAVEAREPVLRLRHSITNTNYYVEVYAEAAMGVSAENFDTPGDALDPEEMPQTGEVRGSRGDGDKNTIEAAAVQLSLGTRAEGSFAPELVPDGPESELEVFEEADGSRSAEERVQRPRGLLAEVPAAQADLLWCGTQRLYGQPLTGLARKALQRLGLMPMTPVRVGSGKGSV